MDSLMERKIKAYVNGDKHRFEASTEDKTAKRPCYYCAAEVHTSDCPSRVGGEETES